MLSSVRHGWGALEDNRIEAVVLFVVVFLGVVAHWAYLVAVQALKNSGSWDWGNLGMVTARLFISFIAAAAGYVAIYEQVQQAPSGFKVVTAFTLGLGVDALTAPWTQQTPAS